MQEGTYRMQKRQIAKVQYLYNGRMQQRALREAKDTLRQKTPEEMAVIKGRTRMAEARRDEKWRLKRRPLI